MCDSGGEEDLRPPHLLALLDVHAWCGLDEGTAGPGRRQRAALCMWDDRDREVETECASHSRLS